MLQKRLVCSMNLPPPQYRKAVANQHRAGDVLDIDRHPLALQDKGAAVPERHDHNFLAGEGFQRGIGILDDDRIVLLDELGEEADARIDIILIAAERLVQYLKPGIADPAIGWDANPALVFGIKQVLI